MYKKNKEKKKLSSRRKTKNNVVSNNILTAIYRVSSLNALAEIYMINLFVFVTYNHIHVFR